MNVLSLFDGMSCGQQALERAGLPVENYYASEIDKYAIQVTMANYPNTIQLGSVVGVDGYSLPKIDLLIGGSPCQSFSFAGKRKGMATKCETEILTLEHYLKLKAEGYEFEGQSYLFWEFMRLLNETKPKYFLLENVEMGEKWEKVLSRAIGVNGIHINSALLSAQNRKRIYWTNIGMIPGGLFGDPISIIQQPKDKGILLKDILESEVDEKYFLSEKIMTGFLAHNKRHIEEKNQTGFNWKPTEGDKKAVCLRANAALCPTDNSIIVHNTMPRSGDPTKGGTGHLSRNDGKTYYLDTGNTNAVEIFNNKRLNETIKNNNLVDNCLIDSYNQSIHTDKSITISTRVNASSCTYIYKNSRIRRLTPVECERLQTVGIVENNVIFALCYESAKNYVSVVSQNPKLLKLVLSAENSELNELVKNVWLSMNANYQSIKHTAPQNVDMQTQKETKKCTNPSQEEIFTIANNVETNAINQLHKEMDFATSNVFINLIEGKITHCGLAEFHLNEHLSTTLKNGNNQLKMFGKEIMQTVEDVEKNLNTKKDNNSIFIMSHLLNIKNLEQALIIYYLFAKNAIIGYTQNETQIKNLSLNFKLSNGYTNHVSDSQRYKMLGNGWTISVIAHIFSYIV